MRTLRRITESTGRRMNLAGVVQHSLTSESGYVWDRHMRKVLRRTLSATYSYQHEIGGSSKPKADHL